MLPSVKTLETAFPGKGAEIRALLTGKTKTRAYQSVRAWERQCFNVPTYIERQQCAINEILEGCGTEAIFGDHLTQPDAAYINMGDTYATTILYDYTRDRWLVTTVGDWIESQEKRGYLYA